VAGGWVLSAASVSFACIQGHEFARPKPMRLEEYTQQKPTVPELTMPKPEPFKIEGLAGVQKPDATPAQVATTVPGIAAPIVNLQREEYARYVRLFEARPPNAKRSFEEKTDYAVALIFLGDYAKAIDVLVALERERPGVYTTAANLGTAYELAGDLKNALLWIGKGIERDASSHHGTEWLHVAILRAKINLTADKEWLKKHTVLEGRENEQRSAEEIVRAVEYQLGERLQFVSPLDAVVCDLFYQAAIRVAPGSLPERRAHFIHESLRFGNWRKTEIAALTKS
jgi:tetratricopeptide (TPR) repeat protein